MLKKGDKAPINTIVFNLENKEVSLQSYLTQKYLLVYFYPKDDTPGCTTEACELRDFNEEIKKLGIVIVGISKDSVKSHNKFKTKHELNFDLLADEEHKIQDDFGVWQPKKFMGREFMGTLRTTFLLDKDGVVLNVWESVTPKGHAQEVFNFIKEL